MPVSSAELSLTRRHIAWRVFHCSPASFQCSTPKDTVTVDLAVTTQFQVLHNEMVYNTLYYENLQTNCSLSARAYCIHC